MVEPEAECTFYKCIKQSEMCNVAFPNRKNTTDFCMTQNIFIVTGLSDESIAMCLFCVMCFFFPL